MAQTWPKCLTQVWPSDPTNRNRFTKGNRTAPQDVRALQGFIQGTPHTGWYDLLDSSKRILNSLIPRLIRWLPGYRMRTGTEARDFFVLGRVFAMLYSETAGQTSHVQPWDEAYTVVRFNERVHTNIRRFVVLQDNRGFVYAW